MVHLQWQGKLHENITCWEILLVCFHTHFGTWIQSGNSSRQLAHYLSLLLIFSVCLALSSLSFIDFITLHLFIPLSLLHLIPTCLNNHLRGLCIIFSKPESPPPSPLPFHDSWSLLGYLSCWCLKLEFLGSVEGHVLWRPISLELAPQVCPVQENAGKCHIEKAFECLNSPYAESAHSETSETVFYCSW